MNTFSRILLRTNPPSDGVPTGFVALEADGGVFTVTDASGNTSTVGRKTRGTPVNGVKATQTLTSNATAPANGQTVTIGNKVYTYQTVLTNVNGNVLIGASAAIALDNLKAAINLEAGAGTLYAAATTRHTQVTATTNTATTQVVEAINPGAWANGIAVAETSANLSWGAATLTGGVNTTPGNENDELFDNAYTYIATADMPNEQAVGAWRRTATSSF